MTNDEQRRIFARNLTYYIEANNQTQKEFAFNIGENPTTVNMWCKGNSMPPVSKIQKIADYFRIGKSALTDDRSKIKPEDIYTDVYAQIWLQDERFKQIIVDYYNMTPSEKTVLCDFWEKFIRKGRA